MDELRQQLASVVELNSCTFTLADLAMDELRQQLASVDELVRKALEALHTALTAHQEVEKSVVRIIDVVIDQAW